MFADHESSMKPIDVPRKWLWNLPRRTVYFGTSVSTIFKGKNEQNSKIILQTQTKILLMYEFFLQLGLVTEEIQQCFWRGMYFLYLPKFLRWIFLPSASYGLNFKASVILKHKIHLSN